jgi:hypothetical protein
VVGAHRYPGLVALQVIHAVGHCLGNGGVGEVVPWRGCSAETCSTSWPLQPRKRLPWTPSRVGPGASCVMKKTSPRHLDLGPPEDVVTDLPADPIATGSAATN